MQLQEVHQVHTPMEVEAPLVQVIPQSQGQAGHQEVRAQDVVMEEEVVEVLYSVVVLLQTVQTEEMVVILVVEVEVVDLQFFLPQEQGVQGVLVVEEK
jgi:hypothetical protein